MTPSKRLKMPKPMRIVPASSLVDQRTCLRWACRHSTNSPAATKTYVLAWKSPSRNVLISRLRTLSAG